MAEFSSNIGSIANVQRPLPRQVESSVDLTPIVNLIGTAASGFIKSRQEKKDQEFLQDFRSKATSVVDDALAGESSVFEEDSDTPKVLGSGERRKIEKLRKAQKSGKMTPAQMFDRINALTKETIATRPEMAESIRDEVKSLVGFNTRAQAVNQMLNQSTEDQRVAENFMSRLFKQATETGNIVMDENGQPNIERTVALQHKMNARKNSVAMEIEQLKLEERRREAQGQSNLTAKEREDNTINKWASVYEEEFNHQVEQALASSNLLAANARETGQEGELEELGPLANRLGQSFLSYLQTDMSRQGVPATVQKEITGLFQERLDRIVPVFADEEFSTLPMMKRQADKLKTALDINIHEALPLIKTIREAGGSEAASAIINVLSDQNNLGARASQEVGSFITNFLQEKPNQANRSKLLLQAHKAKLNMVGMPTDTARQLMKDSIGSLQQLNNTSELDVNSLNSYAEVSKNVLAAATELDDPVQLKRANRIFSSQSFSRHLDKLGKENPVQADLLADHARALNVDLLRFDVPNLKKELEGFMDNSVNLVFNGNTSQYEIEVDRNKLSNKLIGFTKVNPDELRRRTDRQIDEFRAKANVLNTYLNSIAKYNKWDTDVMGDLDEEQVKQFHAVVSHSVAGGIPLKEGTSLRPLPFGEQEFPSEVQEEQKVMSERRTFQEQLSQIKSFMKNNITQFSEQTSKSLIRSGMVSDNNKDIELEITDDGRVINALTGEEVDLGN